MPRISTGLIIHFDEKRRSDLLREGAEFEPAPFSDALSVHDWEIGHLSVALLCFSENTIDYISLAKKGRRVVTSKNRVEFSGMVSLNSISITELEAKLSENIRRFFIRATQGVGGVIPPATWLAIIFQIKSMRPAVANEIDRLFSLRRLSGFKITGIAADILLQEREALGASLDIFNGNNKLRESVLGEWAPREETLTNVNEADETAELNILPRGQSSFLQNIPRRYLQEESAIQHDLFNWPGMAPMHEAGISVFEQGGRKLEVIYANRNQLERTLGVDLIYYNEFYSAFVLIQYKLMREEGEAMLYRPDSQLLEEIGRMNDFHNNRKTTPIQAHEEFRLNEDGFLFKLVPSQGLKPASGELIKGMYLTREYMNFLLGSYGPKGPQGGARIDFQNSPRYLTNSQFSSYVREGLIGTRGVNSDQIRTLIQQFYESGHAVMLAHERPNVRP